VCGNSLSFFFITNSSFVLGVLLMGASLGFWDALYHKWSICVLLIDRLKLTNLLHKLS
jgi:hypothetical protein